MSFSTSLQGFKEIWRFNNRLELIVHLLFRRDQDLCVYRFSEYQVVMLKSGGDLNGMRACLATDQYTQFFDKMDLTRPLKILDLGAHTGGFIFTFLNQGYSVSESLSVEQNRQTYSRLSFNLALNHLQDGCRALHSAVWSSSAQLLSSEGAGRTSGRVEAGSRDNTDESRIVKSYSVNELIKMLNEHENIDICKIDVEGAEWEIFAHSDSCNLLSERCRYLVIEIHPSDKYQIDLQEIIRSLGFEVISKCKYGDETFLYRNAKLLNK